MMKTKLALVIGLAFASCAFGQEQRGYAPSPMPSAASGVRIPMPSDDAVRQGIAAARATGQLSSKQSMDAAAARAKTVADPAALARGVPTGELQDVPMYNQGGKVDPASVAKQYKQMQRNQQSEEDRYNLIVFVSLTMPEETLRKTAEDTRRAGGVVVLRGLKYGVTPGTWVKSLEAMKPLVGTGANVQINPELFQQFSVKAVPMVVVTANAVGDKGCGDGSCAAGVGTIVGDVSLEYALEKIGERGDGVGKIAREKYTKLN